MRINRHAALQPRDEMPTDDPPSLGHRSGDNPLQARKRAPEVRFRFRPAEQPEPRQMRQADDQMPVPGPEPAKPTGSPARFKILLKRCAKQRNHHLRCRPGTHHDPCAAPGHLQCPTPKTPPERHRCLALALRERFPVPASEWRHDPREHLGGRHVHEAAQPQELLRHRRARSGPVELVRIAPLVGDEPLRRVGPERRSRARVQRKKHQPVPIERLPRTIQQLVTAPEAVCGRCFFQLVSPELSVHSRWDLNGLTSPLSSGAGRAITNASPVVRRIPGTLPTSTVPRGHVRQSEDRE